MTPLPVVRRPRWSLPALAVLVATLLALAIAPAAGQADSSLSIAVQGNHFVNGAGQTVRLVQNFFA